MAPASLRPARLPRVVALLGATLGALLLVPAGAPAPAAASTTAQPDLQGPLGSPTPQNFLLASATGNVWTFGKAAYYGAPASYPLSQPIVGITATADGKGYWEVASDGGVFAFGDAGFHGSMGGVPLSKPIVGIAPTPDGEGYWEVASDGGIFSFGDAAFAGSMGGQAISQPIVGITSTADGKGYWELAADGGLFTFGDAGFYGSTGGGAPIDPAERVVPTRDGKGYWIVAQNGTASAFGDAGPTAPTQALLFSASVPAQAAVLFAFDQLGKPYIWGGNGPAGYDCSGLALAAWQHGAGVSFARVSNDQYATAGGPVAMADLAAGDLVFWATSTADPTSVDHTAIYVGGGRIVEATGDHVQLNSLGQWGTGGLMGNGRRP